jgi:ergothioneine biosynthesis protein EgtB
MADGGAGAQKHWIGRRRSSGAIAERRVHAETDPVPVHDRPHSLDYETVRNQTVALCAPLETEDFGVQSMPDASPVKWHLAHTTWFFERFVLRELLGQPALDQRYEYLFNSYYEAVGARLARAERGLLTRPTVEEVLEYRRRVDERMHALRGPRALSDAVAARLELGLHHEQQHQELLLTDLKHAFSRNPLQPAYEHTAAQPSGGSVSPLHWHRVNGGLHEIGAARDGSFSFDNEQPRHRAYLRSFAIAHRLVSNGEYLEFIQDGGYAEPAHWLADGWALVHTQSWRHPLYWSDSLDSEFTLGGRRPIDATEPACHLSYYEADAFARWAGARLPTEAEWELASRTQSPSGNFVESGQLHPAAATPGRQLQQMLGSVWEWTSSAYAPYPGFRAGAGALGEYNGKFMANQYVLRGGSCVTPASHIRATYRNFFYPHQRWQFTGLRLAKDV